MFWKPSFNQLGCLYCYQHYEINLISFHCCSELKTCLQNHPVAFVGDSRTRGLYYELVEAVSLNSVKDSGNAVRWRHTCNKHHCLLINPLGPKSDQHQFSPNNISRSSTVKVMRITQLITKERTLWSFTKFSQLFLKEMYGDQSGEFVCGSLGSKG